MKRGIIIFESARSAAALSRDIRSQPFLKSRAQRNSGGARDACREAEMSIFYLSLENVSALALINLSIARLKSVAINVGEMSPLIQMMMQGNAAWAALRWLIKAR